MTGMRAGTGTSVFDHALTVGKWTLASRLLGFLRDALLAFALGGGMFADAFLVAFRLPNLFRRLLAEGCITLALTPELVNVERREGAHCAFALARVYFWVMAVLFALLAAAGIIGATPLARMLAPGFAQHPGLLELTSTLLALCLLYMPFAAGAAVFSSMLTARNVYAVPAASPLVLNSALIAAIAAATAFCPQESGARAAVICLGVVLAGAAQFLWQLPCLYRMGFRFFGNAPPQRVLRESVLPRLPLAAFGSAGHQLNVLVAALIASFWAEGSIVGLYFAERLAEFPLGVIGASLGLAALTDFSLRSGAAQREEFSASLASVLHMAVYGSVPAAVGLASLSLPLVSTLFGRGAFDAPIQGMAAAALGSYAVGLPALALCRPLLSALNALGDVKRPALAVVLGIAVTGAGGLLCDRMALDAPTRLTLLACCVSAAAWTNAACLYLGLARHGVRPGISVASIAKSAGGGALVGAVVWGLRLTALPQWAVVLFAIPLGAAAYGLATLLWKSPEAALFLDAARKKGRGST